MRYAILILLFATETTFAQCGPYGCRAPGYGYSATYGTPTVIGTPVNSAPVIATAPRAELFDMRQTGPGTYYAVNKQTGAMWNWNNANGFWIHDGYATERVSVPQPTQAYRRVGCNCGCGCVNCRCR